MRARTSTARCAVFATIASSWFTQQPTFLLAAALSPPSSSSQQHQEKQTPLPTRAFRGTNSPKSRDLFDLFIFFTNGTSTATNPPTAAPTPLPDIRQGNYRSCGWEDEQAANASVTNIRFIYDVETTTTTTTFGGGLGMSENAQEALTEILSESLLETLYTTVCFEPERRHLVSSGASSSRVLQIDALGGGTKDKVVASCTPTNPSVTSSCLRYEGSLLVSFDTVGAYSTRDTVRARVIDQLKADMSTGVLVDSVNNAGYLTSDYDVSVTNVTYVNTVTETPEQNMTIAATLGGNFSVEEGGLNLLGKTMVVFLGILFCCVLYLCGKCCMFILEEAYEYDDDSYEERSLAKLVDNPDGYPSDLGLGEEEVEHEDNEIGTYISADFNNLGNPHSKIDVHNCNKKHCELCSQGRPHQLSPINESSPDSDRASPAATDDDSQPSQAGMEIVDGIHNDNEQGKSLLDEHSSMPDDEFLDEAEQDVGGVSPMYEKLSSFGGRFGRKRQPDKEVNFVKVGDIGHKRQVLDPYGIVREEVEL